MKSYGKELIIDIHNCKTDSFIRGYLHMYCVKLCLLIKMQRGPLHFWDYKNHPEEYKKAPPHLKGTSVIQFISTSNITIHSLDDLKRVYLNIFSCKDFNVSKTLKFSQKFFRGKIINHKVLKRY